MFQRVLIANRGEIACRIQKTLRRLGVESVAVFSEADRAARHVVEADQRVLLGPGPAAQSYLNVEAVLRAAQETGAQAIHPGYGFLSENTGFAEAVEAAGMAFVGPTSQQIRSFGLKHEARRLAEKVGVPLLSGSGLLTSVEEAQHWAEKVGFPIMLKSTAGGGGIGMQIVERPADLPARFESVRASAQKNFADGGLFLERYIARARHVEVQLFGAGDGRVVVLGDRDCSLQRRNQKVVEEAPAPGLSVKTRQALHEAALKLAQAVSYRSAGTVEFIYDAESEDFFFLEVNTRLQVEHGVTELVTGIDLVEWMLRVAAGETVDLRQPAQQGHAIEVRLYAEDPARDFRPSAGTLTQVVFPTDIRVDAWVEPGTEVSAFYDPMLGKLLVHADERSAAIDKLAQALDQVRLSGIETNLAYLRKLCRLPEFVQSSMTTGTLKSLQYGSASVEVLTAGTFTTLQEYPGRVGYWDVGIPPSGPMDSLNFRLANIAVGNPPGAAALECTLNGPILLFSVDTTIALTGAALHATLDGETVGYNRPVAVRAGQCLKMGALTGPGCRAYLALRGGFDVPSYLGSRATFTLGGFGGHGGRILRRGDVLHLNAEPVTGVATAVEHLRSDLSDDWEIAVLYGPHGAPDFFTEEDVAAFFAATWTVHFNSARTGVRLIGPKPTWARKDGGEAGLHPSNIHDTAYAFGSVDFTGDMPIILGPDGPSLGGFVCPATVVNAELWKLGQLKAGSQVRFRRVSVEQAAALDAELEASLASQVKSASRVSILSGEGEPHTPVVGSYAAQAQRPEVVYRQAGDRFLLVEYGPMTLDLALRFRVHLLMQHLRALNHSALLELTPGVRSLQIHFNSQKLSQRELIMLLEAAETALPSLDTVQVPTRTVRLPLSWDDPQTRLAIERYVAGVRKDAPWAPSNIEFIRRINGLESIDDVKRIVFDARYLVLGLGDVYLGAPVATPLDPRHRLVTTKYNPARTWTPENAVGIGGAYMCIYGMEGPGGYQFVGRTVQVFSRQRVTDYCSAAQPWLLRFFDQIQFYPVSADELLEMRAQFAVGRLELDIQPGVFRLGEYQAGLRAAASEIAAFKQTQQAAFEAERQRWAEADRLKAEAEPQTEAAVVHLLDGAEGIESPVHGSVWQVRVAKGANLVSGDVVVVLESMKMEISVPVDCACSVVEVLVREGDTVVPGQALLLILKR